MDIEDESYVGVAYDAAVQAPRVGGGKRLRRGKADTIQ
jgi:hypothetical protein